MSSTHRWNDPRGDGPTTTDDDAPRVVRHPVDDDTRVDESRAVDEPRVVDEPRHVDETRPVVGVDGDTVVARERDEFGGVKVGSAFFGWLTATGMAVLLTALAAAAGAALGLATSDTIDQAASGGSNAQTVGIAGAVVLLVILFVSYFCGGYVAGRMARFHGARQGVAVWVWALAIAVLVAIAGAVAGNKYDVFAQTNVLPRIPVNEGDLTTAGIIAAVAVAVVSLVAAVLGGVAGMRFHRRVDRHGLDI
jgi:hypothetical protein